MIPVAAGSKAWVCGPSLAGFVGPNPAGGVDVCLFRLCVVRYRLLRRTDHPSRRVIPRVIVKPR